MNLLFNLEAQPEEWIIRGPVSPPRRLESPLADKGFRSLAASLREWASRPVPLDRPDPLGTEAFVQGLARRVSARLTEILLTEDDRRAVAATLIKAGQARLVIRVRPAAEKWNQAADAALALPWELLAPEAGGVYPVRDGRLAVIREAATDGAPGLSEPSGPLTLAVTIAAPEDRAGFPYEQESFRLLAALAPLGQRAVFSNLGGLDDLVDLVADVRATAIHFRGHGLPGGLLFEDGLGFAAEVSVAELRRCLAAVLLDPQRTGTFPGLIFLAAPFTAQEAEEAASAAALHRSGFVQVIGFFGPVDADLNTLLEEHFYGALAEGRSVLAAVEEARTALLEPVGAADERVRYPFGWCQLAVYHRGPDLPLARPGVGEDAPLVQRRIVELSGLPVLEHGFIGRRGLQHEVRRKVERDGQRLVVIQGLGGLGKTALASQLLVRAFAPEPPNQLVLRCGDLAQTDGDPVLELRSQAEEHGRIQNLPFWDERVKDLRERIPDPAAGLAAVLRLLRQALPGLAVYIDNAETLQTGPTTDDPAVLGSWRPGLEAWWGEMERLAESEGCLVLVTTRYSWEGLSPRAHVGLPPMGPADSLRLIDSFEALRDLPLDVQVRLAERVDGHPRTVEFLDKLIAQRREEIREVEDTWNDLIVPILPAQEEKIRADLLLEKLWDKLSEEAKEHARALAVLRRPAPQFVIDRMGVARDELVRAGWLTRYREQVLGEEGIRWIDLWGLYGSTRDFMLSENGKGSSHEAHLLAAEAFEQALQCPVFLRTDQAEAIYHLQALREGDRAWPVMRDHVLWLRQTARFQEARDLVQSCEAAAVTGDRLALALVLQMQMRSSLGERGESLFTLLDRAAALAESPESQGVVLQERADLMADLGRFAEAEALLRQVQALDEAAFGTDHLIYCATLHAMAMVIDHQGRHTEAEVVLREALERTTRALGPAHDLNGAIFHNLAGILERQGRYSEAEEAIRKALSFRSETEDYPGYASSLHVLAQILERQGQYQAAEDVIRRSLSTIERAFGEGHPNCATTLNTLATIVAHQARPQETERLLRRSLEITASTLGTDHYEYGVSLQMLGSSLDEQGRLQEAEESLRRAIQIQERALGPEHPALLPTLQSLGTVVLHQSRRGEAEEIFRRNIDLTGQILGTRHPSYAASLQNLASLLLQFEQLDEAEALLRQALEIDEATYSLDHPSYGSTLFTLAQVLESQGRHDEAEVLIRRSLRIDEDRLGTDHPSYLASLHELAFILESRGQLKEAEWLLRHSLAVQEQKQGPEHPDLAPALTNLARFLEDQGDPEEAEELLERALHISQLPGRENARAFVEALASMAEVQSLLERAEAPETARQALDALEATLDPDHPTTKRFLPTLQEIEQGEIWTEAPLPTPEEIAHLEEEVTLAREAGTGPEARFHLREKLDDLAGLLIEASRLKEAVLAMEEVVAIGEELQYSGLAWDRRILQRTRDLLETSEQNDEGIAPGESNA